MRILDREVAPWIGKKRFIKREKRKEVLRRRGRYRVNAGIDHVFHKRLIAPLNFSFVNNPQEMNDYFCRAESFLMRGIPVKFDLRYIVYLTPDAIAVLSSRAVSRRVRPDVRVGGTAPRDKKLRRMFLGSGFYEYVSSNKKPKVSKGNALLRNFSNKKVDTSIAKKYTDYYSQYVSGIKKPFSPLFEMLIELMANTHNHASLDGEGVFDWWLYFYHDEENKVATYSFFDFGVGVFESQAFLKYYNLLLFQLSRKMSFQEKVDAFLDGKITSKTGLVQRGMGIPSILEYVGRSEFKDAVMISNEVYINLKRKESIQLGTGFKGTFVYWEVGYGD